MTFKTPLSRKVLLIIGPLIILAIVAILYVSNVVLLNSFIQLENRKVFTDLERVQEAVKAEIENLESICGDWAPWDDSRNFMLGQSPDYIKSNLAFDTLNNLNLDFMIFIDTAGKIFHTAAIDVEKNIVSPVPSELLDHILARGAFSQLKEPKQKTSGLEILPDKIVLIAAQPISDSMFEGPVSGILIVGRYLNDRFLNALSEKTRLDISLIQNDNLTKKFDNELSKDDNIFVRVLDKNILLGYAQIYDLHGDKHITLKVNIIREIYLQGRQTVRYFMFAIIFTFTAIMVIILLVMQKAVLQPIKKLTETFMDIHKNPDADTKLYTDRNDEIGTLAKSFDKLMLNLKEKLFQLKDSEKRFQEVAENSGDWIWETNAEGLYIYSSPVVEKILGYKPQEIIGKKYFYDFFPTDQKEILKNTALEAMTKREKFISLINPNIHKNGSTVILETHGTPVLDEKGNLCGYRGADRNVTERTKAENDLKQLLSLHTATLESTGHSLIVTDLDGKIVLLPTSMEKS